MNKVIIISSKDLEKVTERLNDFTRSIELQPLALKIIDNNSKLTLEIEEASGDIMVFGLGNSELFPKQV